MKKVLRSLCILVLIAVLLLMVNLWLPNVLEATIAAMSYPIGVILHPISIIVIGMLFGMERVYDLRLQDGSWKFDMTRLIVIIPLLVLSFSFNLYFGNQVIRGIIGPIIAKINFESQIIGIAQLVTGLQIMNAIYKE